MSTEDLICFLKCLDAALRDPEAAKHFGADLRSADCEPYTGVIHVKEWLKEILGA